jgi:hypothetical protein
MAQTNDGSGQGSRAGLPRRPPAVAVRLALRLRQALLRLADRVVPPHVALADQALGNARAAGLAVMAELGVADLMTRPRTASELAAQVGADPDLLHRTMRALVLSGVFTLDRSGRFALTAIGERLRRDHPDSMWSAIRYWSCASHQQAWAALPDVVRTGRPAFPAVHGRSVWTWFEEHPDEGRLFASAMRRLSELDAPDIVDLVPWPVRGTVCDLGGGAGSVLSRLLQARPGLRGVLVEASAVIPEADRLLTERGVRDRVDLIEGSFFSPLSVDADVHLLKHVLHDWDDDACGRILGTVHQAMAPGSTLIVVEYLQEPNVATFPASLSDLQMAVVCDAGRERSLSQIRSLLAAAGFGPGPVRTSPTGLALISAHR